MRAAGAAGASTGQTLAAEEQAELAQLRKAEHGWQIEKDYPAPGSGVLNPTAQVAEDVEYPIGRSGIGANSAPATRDAVLQWCYDSTD